MTIKKYTGTITNIIDLSQTAKEVEITLAEPMEFIPGSFVNVFITIRGERVRRAYSIASSATVHDRITLAIRLSPQGTLTPLFWNSEMIGQTVELMGPLGLNTADKMHRSTIYLFGFGIGAGVVKSLADYFSTRSEVTALYIMTGSRTEDEILYKEYFDSLAKTFPNVHVSYIVSKPMHASTSKKGYTQDHLEGLDFNDADIYMCGQESACNDLATKIKEFHPDRCAFFIEGFH